MLGRHGVKLVKLLGGARPHGTQFTFSVHNGAVLGLVPDLPVFNAVVKLWKGAIKDKAGLCIFAIVFVLSIFLDVSPVVYVVVTAAAGILLTQMGVRGK